MGDEALLLAGVAFAAAALSGMVGMGGGTVLVAAMASVLPPVQVVPLHGLVQLCSNSTRGLLLLRHTVWSLVALWLPLQVVGMILALQLYRGDSLAWFKPGIGVFVLCFLLWDRLRPRRLEMPRWVFALAGLGGGALTVLVGVSGPYLAAFFLRDDLAKEEIVATKAVIQTVGHLLKIPAFVSLGFAYHEHLALVLPLVAAAFLGTWVGTRLLTRVSARWFQLLFRVVLAALGVRLVASIWT